MKAHKYIQFFLIGCLFFISLFPGKSSADEKSANSLFRIIHSEVDDSLKFKAILEFTMYLIDTEPNSALFGKTPPY